MNKNYILLNNKVNMKDNQGNYINLDLDKQAVKEYFLNNVNQNTVFFHSLEEKLNYLIDEGYYDKKVLDKYTMEEIKEIFKIAYSKKIRFRSYTGAVTFYERYAMRTTDKERILERYEDRLSMIALTIGRNFKEAKEFIEILANRQLQGATPVFMNSGKLRAGELVSCALLDIQDNLESINYAMNSTAQLSKAGSGVGLNLNRLRARGETIKGVIDSASGVLPPAKVFEDLFSYINQLGSRNGAGVVHLSIFHNDIEEFINSKKVNADEKLRLKTLSTAIIVPDKFMELLSDSSSRYYYTFNPKNVYDITGIELDDMDMNKWYDKLVENRSIKKTQRDKLKLVQEIIKSQKESGFSYIIFIDTMNREHNLKKIGRINMSNLCVAPYIKILTKEYGYIEIKKVENQLVNVWNGEQWSETIVKKTGENQKLLRVEVKDINTGVFKDVDCTEYHKFYLKDGKKINANELKIGDKLLEFYLPFSKEELIKHKITSIVELKGLYDTYCFNEPLRNMGMFNGMLLGNCTEIAQLNTPSEFSNNIYEGKNNFGYDIQCVLSSLNLVKLFTEEITDTEKSNVILSSMKFLSNVSDLSNNKKVPTLENANKDFHSVGLGVMGLNTLFVKYGIEYESEEAKDLTNLLFSYIRFYSLYGSMEIAKERGKFKYFEKSDYANGKALEKYINGTIKLKPQTEKVKSIINRMNILIPNERDWHSLSEDIMKYGLYNAYQLAVAPNQSSAYIMEVSPSVAPVSSEVEFRDYGYLQTVYPMPLLTNENRYLYKSAYDIDQKKMLDLVRVMQDHIDQAISTVVNINSDTTMKEHLGIIIYAWKIGIKTLYYWRTRKQSIMADKEPICESCSV